MAGACRQGSPSQAITSSKDRSTRPAGIASFPLFWRMVAIAFVFLVGGTLMALSTHLFRSQYPYRTLAQRRAALIVAGVSLVVVLLMLGVLAILVPPVLH